MNTRVLGLTGGVGMGKSTAARLLKKVGLPVVDSDDLAREAVHPGTEGLAEIADEFGEGFLKADGSLNRDKMASKVFQDEAARKRLEAIIHPRVRTVWEKQIDQWREQKRPVGVVVIPLLFEVDLQDSFDAVLCVACTANTQRARLRERNWNDAQITARIAAQMDIAQKMDLADHVLWNEGAPELLMDQMKEQAKAVGTEMIENHIASVNLKSKPFEAIGESGQKYTADSIIISTGAQARWLNIKSEQEYKGFGVSACATCDGFFFKDKTVAVVGGGNAAVEEAMFLTKFASKVKLIHRRNELRAEKMLQKKLMENKKIEIVWDTVVEDVLGDKDPKNVTGLKVKNVKTNQSEEMKIDGLFIAIGHDPATQLFKDQLKMDKEGYLITKPDSTETNVPGVFAAGDVKDKIFRQAVTAAGMGCMAALEAEKHLSHN